MNQIRAAAPNRIVALSAQLYAWLLAVYPPRFRAEYGPHMAQVFRDCCRDAYGQRRIAGVAWLWLSTLVDWIVTAVSEWFAGKPGPGHYAYKVGVGLAAGMAGGVMAGLAAGMAGGVMAGLGARLSMRGVALAAGLAPGFSVEGTLVIVLAGLLLGMPFGVGFVALRRFLPGEGIGQGLAYGLLLIVVFMVPPLLFYREGEALLASPLIGLALFAPLGLIYGGVVSLAAARLERDRRPRPPTAARPAAASKSAVGGQLMAVVAFAGLLELGVLGALSITNYMPRLPLGIIYAVRDAHISFSLAWDASASSVNLIALAYFGLSSLIFWQRGRSPMPRIAAIALLLFGGALFNTGAAYFARLSPEAAFLQPLFHVLQIAGCTAILALLYLFPDGRPAARWLTSLGLSWGAWTILWVLSPDLPDWLSTFALAVFLSAGVIAQHRRYRLAPAEEQEQLRWPLRGFVVAVAGFTLVAILLAALPDLKLPRVPGPAAATTVAPYMLPWLFLPVSIGYAMWQRRLWAA